MDVNYLLAREQISLMHAEHSGSAEARFAHRGLARGYAALLVARGFPRNGETPVAANVA